MAHLGKCRQRIPADPLGGRVGAEQGRVFILQCLQASEQTVIFSIRNFRIIQHIIAVAVVIQCGTQLCGFFGGSLGCGRDRWQFLRHASSLMMKMRG